MPAPEYVRGSKRPWPMAYGGHQLVVCEEGLGDLPRLPAFAYCVRCPARTASGDDQQVVLIRACFGDGEGRIKCIAVLTADLLLHRSRDVDVPAHFPEPEQRVKQLQVLKPVGRENDGVLARCIHGERCNVAVILPEIRVLTPKNRTPVRSPSASSGQAEHLCARYARCGAGSIG